MLLILQTKSPHLNVQSQQMMQSRYRLYEILVSARSPKKRLQRAREREMLWKFGFLLNERSIFLSM